METLDPNWAFPLWPTVEDFAMEVGACGCCWMCAYCPQYFHACKLPEYPTASAARKRRLREQNYLDAYAHGIQCRFTKAAREAERLTMVQGTGRQAAQVYSYLDGINGHLATIAVSKYTTAIVCECGVTAVSSTVNNAKQIISRKHAKEVAK